MIELNTMEFDGKTYFEIETITHNNNTYIMVMKKILPYLKYLN